MSTRILHDENTDRRGSQWWERLGHVVMVTRMERLGGASVTTDVVILETGLDTWYRQRWRMDIDTCRTDVQRCRDVHVHVDFHLDLNMDYDLDVEIVMDIDIDIDVDIGIEVM